MTSSSRRTIDVVGAVILRDGRVLAAQRGAGGSLPPLWEFPGGKIEGGESAEHALAREIREELSFDVRVGEPVATTIYEYEFATVRLATFYCEPTDGEPQLNEHAALRWLTPTEMLSVTWAPADIPAVEQVRRDLL